MPEGNVGVKLWLDDYRMAPEGWEHVRTAAEAIAALEKGGVDEISLDYHLGDWRDDLQYAGRAVSAWIARGAFDGTVPRIKWHIHSDSVEGREIMLRHMEKAEQFWTESEMVA